MAFQEFLPTSAEPSGKLFRFSFPSPGVAGNLGPSLVALRLHDSLLLLVDTAERAIKLGEIQYRHSVFEMRNIILRNIMERLSSGEGPRLTSGRRTTFHELPSSFQPERCRTKPWRHKQTSQVTSGICTELVSGLSVDISTQLLNVAAGTFTTVGDIFSHKVSIDRTVVWGGRSVSPPQDIPVIETSLNVGYIVLSLPQSRLNQYETLLFTQLMSVPQLFKNLQVAAGQSRPVSLSIEPRRVTVENCVQIPSSVIQGHFDALVVVGPEPCIINIGENAATNSQPILGVVLEFDVHSCSSRSCDQEVRQNSRRHTHNNMFWLVPKASSDGDAIAAIVDHFNWDAISILQEKLTTKLETPANIVSDRMEAAAVDILHVKMKQVNSRLELDHNSLQSLRRPRRRAVSILSLSQNSTLYVQRALYSANLLDG